MKVLLSSETSENTNPSTERQNSEDLSQELQRCGNLTSHKTQGHFKLLKNT